MTEEDFARTGLKLRGAVVDIRDQSYRRRLYSRQRNFKLVIIKENSNVLHGATVYDNISVCVCVCVRNVSRVVVAGADAEWPTIRHPHLHPTRRLAAISIFFYIVSRRSRHRSRPTTCRRAFI